MDLTKLSKDELLKMVSEKNNVEKVMENTTNLTSNEVKWLEVLTGMWISNNALPQSTATWLWWELVKELTWEIINVSRELKNNMLTPAIFSWYQWTNMPESKKFPVIWEVWFMRAWWESKTWPIWNSSSTSNVPTKKVTITQGQYKIAIDITRAIKTFWYEWLEQHVKEEIAKSWNKTLNAVVFNADDTEWTTNINFAWTDVATANEDYFLVPEAAWFRKLAIQEQSTVLIWDVDYEWLVSMIAKMWSLADNPSDCIFVMDRQTYLRYLTVEEFKNASENWINSVIHKWAHFNFLGSDLFIIDSLKRTNIDWEVSATPAENTKWQIMLINKSALQYWFWDDLNLKVNDYWANWLQLEGWGYFWHWIFNEYASWECPVVLWRWVNLS